MVQVKKMNENFFAKLLRGINVSGELIRARQEEKQGVLDDFDKECKRFFFGKISERALATSVKKTNRELKRLDASVRSSIATVRATANKTVVLTVAQAPISYRTTLSGITGGNVKAKKKPVKKKVKIKTVKRKAKKKEERKTVKKKASKRRR